MKPFILSKKIHLPIAAILLLGFAFVIAGCAQPQAATEPAGEHDETGASDRVPNEGAVIHIVSPEDGATFNHGEDVVVEIDVENFDLSAEGNHWHLYVDGSVFAMVAGGSTKEVLHSLEPGEHQIEVYLGLPTHEELEDGAEIMIMVSE